MALMVSGLFCVYLLLQSTAICDCYTLRGARDVKNAAEVQLREEFSVDGEPMLKKEMRIFQERVSENGNELTNSSKVSLNTTVGIINITKDIIYTGLNNIKNDVDEVPEEVDNVRPTMEDWHKLNASLEHFFNKSEDGLTIQNITNSFQNMSVNFLSSFQQEQSTKETHYQKQVQRPGLIGQLISGGTQQVLSNINSLDDTRQNPISNFFNSFNRANSTERPSTTPAGLFQGAVSQFGNFVNNFRSTTTTTTTTTTTARTPLEMIQNFGNQIGNAIQTSIFGQNNRTPVMEDEPPSTQPPNLVQNIGQAIQNANPFRPQSTTPAPPNSNPMEMLMCFNVGKMVSNIRQRH